MGTMKEADKKSAFRFCAAFTIIVAILALMTYGNLFNTYLFDYFKAGVARENLIQSSFWRALAKFSHYLGIVAFGVSIFSVWKLVNYTFGEKSGWLYGAIALGLAALGIFLAAGFNFDLHGIS